ncbi:hypothetical protein AbraIFM66950_011671 [Aspergillus brasiliensis]|nr:hypothetical protein AbraIFM66950_011671 [Aspergillus brasiliensis]
MERPDDLIAFGQKSPKIQHVGQFRPRKCRCGYESQRLVDDVYMTPTLVPSELKKYTASGVHVLGLASNYKASHH